MELSDENVGPAAPPAIRKPKKRHRTMQSIPRRHAGSAFHDWLLPAFAILPAFLGGGTERWSEGVVLLGLGLLLLLAPPKRSAGVFFNSIALGILACAAAAFLPCRWFPMPAWRTEALENHALSLGSLVTAQPWLTAEAFALLAAGVAWFLFVCSQETDFDRRVAIRHLCAGVALLAAVSIWLHSAGRCWPIGTSIANFGPFPNRNQTADLLALGTVLAMASVHEDYRRGNRIWILSVLGGAAMLWGVFLAGSRAGAVMCFFGMALWAGCLAVLRRSGRRFGVAVGILLMLLGGFLLSGGATFERFFPVETGASSIPGGNLRWLVQRDAFALAKSAPLFGFGLGNFDGIFWIAPHRAMGAADFHVLHPESDWLWLWIEMGWPAVLLVVCGATLAIARTLPMGTDPNWRLRAAAVAAALVFAIHGTVDVPAHRLGTVFPALLICALAIAPGRVAKASFLARCLFRVAGAAFCAVGAIWFMSATNGILVPGAATAQAAAQQAAAANAAADYTTAAKRSDEAIRLTPLDWFPYYQRAVATALGRTDWQDALTDFRRARFLNPTTADVPFKEGLVWLKVNSPLVLPAWQEALSRSTGVFRPDLYVRMLASTGTTSSELRCALAEMVDGNNALTLLFLDQATQTEFREGLKKVLTEDPDLKSFSTPQKETLFRLWAAKASRSDLVREAEARQSWMAAGWQSVAAVYGGNGDFRHAFEIARRRIDAAPPRDLGTADAPIEIRRAFYTNPRNFIKGYAFCEMEARRDRTEEALQTLQTLTAMEHCPGYIYLLQADILARLNKWQEAWQALLQGSLVHP